ncbi:MAG: ParB/RepB/Spo0J family partition protein [Proteobacteria bacterium]|nr:ParB/RepB/Spo0J family partition protein [Pseudomonadota bacterium]
MATRRNALGRGLGALIPSTPTPTPRGGEPTAELAAAPAPGAQPASGLAEIPVDRIDPNPEQPRRRFEAAELEPLVESLRRHGVLQPVVVRRAGERFELIVGERRWRAARAAGLSSVPAVISDVAPADRLELAIVENVQRRDLNPIELAHAYRALSDSGHTQDEIGKRVGIDRSSVANLLRLLELPTAIQEDVEQDRLSMGHAKALLQVTNPERRRYLRDEIVKQQLSVREAERRGREVAGPAPQRKARGPRRPLDPHLQHLVDELRQRLQTRVRIQGAPDRGRIEIEYFGVEDLERISDLLLGQDGR